MKSSKNDKPTDQNNSGRIDSPSEDPSDDVSISRTWASIHRGQLRQSLQIFAIVAVAILLLAMLHQVVVEAYSQFEDKVEPVSGIDWHIPYGETETVDNETIAVTGDIIVEGTLIINDSLVYMSSIDPAVVNKIDVKPWGTLLATGTYFTAFNHSRPYATVLSGETTLIDCTLSHLSGEGSTPNYLGGLHIRTDSVTIEGCTVMDCSNGPGILVYRCSPRISNTTVTNCTVGIRVENSTVGSTPPVPVIARTNSNDTTGEGIGFSASGSSDPDGTIKMYKWDFGNGIMSSIEEPTVYYSDGGNYTITLSVYDNSGNSNTTDYRLTVKNRPPVANVGDDFKVVRNEPFWLNGWDSYDADGIIVNYTWDLGNGQFAYGVDPVYTFTSGTYVSVKLNVTDDDAATNETMVNLTIVDKDDFAWNGYMNDSYHNSSTTSVPPLYPEVNLSVYAGMNTVSNASLVSNGTHLFYSLTYYYYLLMSPYLSVLNTTTENSNWTILDCLQGSSPVILPDGTVAIVFNNGDAMCFDPDNPGSAIWNFDSPLYHPVNTSITYAEGNVVFTTSDGYVYCLFSNNGTLKWSQTYKGYNISLPSSAPAIAYGGVFFTSSNGTLFNYSLQDGSEVWNLTLSAASNSSISCFNHSIFVGQENGNISYINANGTLRGNLTTAGPVRAPAVFTGTGPYYGIFGSGDGYIYAVNEHDGTYLWTYDVSSPVYHPLILCDKYVLVCPESNILHLLDAEDGDLIWTYDLVYEQTSPPILAGGNIYLRDSEGYIRSIDAPITFLNGTFNETYNWSNPSDKPDLAVTAADVWYNRSAPLQHESFTIVVRVRNVGWNNATNVNVTLYLDGTSYPGDQIGNLVIPTIPKGEYCFANFTASIAEIGKHKFFVELDHNNTTHEYIETNDANTNNFANKTVIISQQQFSPDIANSTISGCEIGMYVVNITTIEFDNMTLEGNEVDVRAVGSIVVLRNSQHSRPMFVSPTASRFIVDYVSNIYLKYDLTLNVLNGTDRNPDVNKNVEVRRSGGTLAHSGTTDTNGVFGPVLATHVRFYQGGLIDWYSAYNVSLIPAALNASLFRILIDAPKNMTVYTGGDSDGDGLNDSMEKWDRILCTEAEAHTPAASQIVQDLRASNGYSVKSNESGVCIHSELVESWNSSKAYWLYVEARQTGDSDSIWFDVCLSATVGGSPIEYTNRSYGLNPDGVFHWYRTQLLNGYPSIDPVNLTVKVSSPFSALLVDRLMIVQCEIVDGPDALLDPQAGQITNPIANDTDRDFLTDNYELSEYRYWFDAEFIDFDAYSIHIIEEQTRVVDSNASNGLAYAPLWNPNPLEFVANISSWTDEGEKDCAVMFSGRDYTGSTSNTSVGINPTRYPSRELWDVSWAPSTAMGYPFALAVGGGFPPNPLGNLWNFNPSQNTFTTVQGFNPGVPMYGVSWCTAAVQNPYAIIVGAAGQVYRYDNNGVITRIWGANQNIDLWGVDVAPNGNTAVITGDSGFVYKYTAAPAPGSLSLVASGGNNLRKVSWDPSGSVALIAGFNGDVVLYTASSSTTFTFSSIMTGTSNNLWGCGWSVSGSQALIVGERMTVVDFDGGAFSVRIQGTSNDPTLYDVAWKSQVDYAIAVGDDKQVLQLFPMGWNNVSVRATDTDYHAIDWLEDDGYPLIGGRWFDPSPQAFATDLSAYVPPPEFYLTVTEESPPWTMLVGQRYYLAPEQYTWFTSPNFTTSDSYLHIIIWGWKTPWFINIWDVGLNLDSINIACLNNTTVKAFSNGQQSLTLNFAGGTEETYYIDIPEGTTVTDAHLVFSGTFPIFNLDPSQTASPDIFGRTAVYQRMFVPPLSVIPRWRIYYIADVDAGAGPSAPALLDPDLYAGEQLHPRIYEDLVVYEEGGAIYLANLSENPVSPQLIDQQICMNPDIFGDWIVYQKMPEGEIDWDIKGYYLPSQTIHNLSYDYHDLNCDESDDYDQTEPAIHGQRVVWQDDYNGVNNRDIYVLELNDFWTRTYQYDKMISQVFSAGYVSRRLDGEIFGWGDVIRIAGTSEDEVHPDIHGNTVVWTSIDDYSDADVCLRDLRSWNDPVTLAGDPNLNDQNARVTGDSVVWHRSDGDSSEVRFYDLAMDQDMDGVPNFMEVPLHPQDSATFVISNTNIPPYPITPAVYGDVVLWTDDMEELWEVWQDFGLRIGSWIDDERDWNCTEIPIMFSRLTGNLAEAINNYTNTVGYGLVPIVFHTDLQTATLIISRLDVQLGFPTHPIESDTDKDHIYDGYEVFYYYGADIVEFEDTIDFKEWKDPFGGLADTVKYRSAPFLHQGGVTLTSTENYPNHEPGEGEEDVYTDSLVHLVFTASDTGYHRLVIQPRAQPMTTVDKIFVKEPGDNKLMVPVQVLGENIMVLPDIDNFTSSLLEHAFWINVTEYGDVPVYPTENVTMGRPLSITRGLSTGIDWKDTSIADTDDRASIETLVEYEGVFYLKQNVSYDIEVSLNLSRVPSSLQPPNDVEWSFVQLLRVVDLDRIIVERRSMDPMVSDSDHDLLQDGVEAWTGGFPLNPDADRDGIIDRKEMEYGTDGTSRDSDMDGLRDGVELGLSRGEMLGDGGWVQSWGSWFERIVRNGSPFNYSRIVNWDRETTLGHQSINTTDPLAFDTDGDGLPDGWRDGWLYQDLHYKEVDVRTYDNTNRYSQMRGQPYNESRWGLNGEVDRLCQVYEGEDLNLDGAVDDEVGQATWGFINETLEIDRGSIDGYNPKLFDETDPTDSDSDSDSIPDGYEVWMSVQEPFHWNGDYILDPTNDQDWDDDHDVSITLIEGGYDPGIGASCYMIEQWGKENVVGRAVRVGIGPGEDVAMVALQLSTGPNTHLSFRVYGENMYQPIWDTVIVGEGNGWYVIDVKDSVLVYDIDRQNASGVTPYYIAVWTYFDTFNYTYWAGSDSGTGCHYIWEVTSTEDKTELKTTGGKLGYLLYGYEDCPDGLRNQEEYIVGTDPKNSNTDSYYVGLDLIDDELKDGNETLASPGDPFLLGKGGIIFRTNVTDGAMTYDHYEAADDPYIDYDGDGEGASLDGYRYTPDDSLAENPVVDPDPDFAGFSEDNILLFVLSDGARIYLTPEETVDGTPSKRHEFIYVFSPDTEFDDVRIDVEEKREFKSGRCLVLKAGGSTHSMDNYRINDTDAGGHFYKNRMMYLSDPFHPDTDMDGIMDGYERHWNYTGESEPTELNRLGWREESESNNGPWLTPRDTLINCRDADSDGDGLSDLDEPGWVFDFDGDGRANMADPDSDDDGVLDGDEVQYWADIDLDGEDWQVNTEYSDSGKFANITVRVGCNMMDTDSDDDGINDSAEMDPFMLFQSASSEDQKAPLNSKVPIFDHHDDGFVEDSVSRLDVASNGEVFFIYDEGSICRFSGKEINASSYSRVTSRNYLEDLSIYGNLVYFTVDKFGTGVPDGLYCVNKDGTGQRNLMIIDNPGAIDVDTSGRVFLVVGSTAIKYYDVMTDSLSTVLETDHGIEDLSTDGEGNLAFVMDDNVFLLESGFSTDSPDDNTPIQLTDYSSGNVRRVEFGRDKDILFTKDNSLVILKPDYDRTGTINNHYNLQMSEHYAGYTTDDVSVGHEGSLYLINSTGDIIEKANYSKTKMFARDTDGDWLLDGYDLGSEKGELSTHPIYSLSIQVATAGRTHPLTPDCDNDGLTDGQEVNTVFIKIEDWQNATNRTQLGYIKCPILNKFTSSDPNKPDTDGDGLSDYLEHGYTDPAREDTDFDGIKDFDEDDDHDGKVGEDTDHNGRYDPGETSPVDRDTDNDCLPDGWNDSNRNGKHEVGELDGEDFDWNGQYWDNERHPDPRQADTDGDGILDGIEFQYLLNLTGETRRDSDDDTYFDVVEYDSDNDGLSDGEENFDHDIWLDTFENMTDEQMSSYPLYQVGCWGNYSEVGTPANKNDTLEQNEHVINYTWSDGVVEQIDVGQFEVTYSGYIFVNRTSNSTHFYSFNLTYSNAIVMRFRVNSTSVWHLDETGTGWSNYSYNGTDADHAFLEPGYNYFELIFRNTTNQPLSQIILNWSYGPPGPSGYFEYGALTILDVMCIGGTLADANTYYMETDPTDPDSDDDGLMDYAEPDRWQDTDGDGFINAWDQDSNDGIPNPDSTKRIDNSSTPGTSDDDYEEVYVVLRRDADKLGEFEEYESGTWLAVDPRAREGVGINIYTQDLVLKRYSFVNIVGTVTGPLERLQVQYGDPYFGTPKVRDVDTPEGYPVYWRDDGSTNGDIYVKLPDDTYANHSYDTSGQAWINNTSVPQAGYGFMAKETVVNFVRYHQETYDPRKALNMDSDFDGIVNPIEIAYGTNPYDADTDNDGVPDGNEPFWNVDSDGDGDWVVNPLTGFMFNHRINALDQDSDNDGICDGVELGYTASTVHNHTSYNITPLNENETIPEEYEGEYLDWTWAFPSVRFDSDPTTTTDPLNIDTDGDGLPDGRIKNWHCTEDSDGSLKWSVTSDPDYTWDDTFQAWQGEDMDLDGGWDSGNGETSANIPDSDYDGIPDGYERVFNCSGWIPGESEGSVSLPTDTQGALDEFIPMNPLAHDTDGDGLYDPLEISWPLALVVDPYSSPYYHDQTDLDTTTRTNPTHSDSDFDNITDDQEDKNRNGMTDGKETSASSPDTDGDGLLDGTNLPMNATNTWLSTSFNIYIFDPTDFPEWGDWMDATWTDFDDKGNSNPSDDVYFYIGEVIDDYHNGTNTDPGSNDTDRDGLRDGRNIGSDMGELSIHFIIDHPDLVLGAPLNKTFPIAGSVANQTKPTDPNDEDSDDDELTDFMEVSGWDVTIIYEKDKRTHSKRWVMSNPNATDTDSDGVSDYYEYFNFSDPVRADTDADHIPDAKETQGNLTQIEGMDPEIVGDIEAHVEVVWDTFLGIPYPKEMKVVVTVTFRDNAGLDEVGIKISGNDWKMDYAENATLFVCEKEFDANIGRVLFCGWDIDVKAVDVNGNGVTGSSHLDGIVEGIIKAILAFLKTLWEAVKELASKLFSWIWNFIKTIVSVVMKPILDALENIGKAVINKLSETFPWATMNTMYMIHSDGGGNSSDKDSGIDYNAVFDDIFTNIEIIALAIFIGVAAVDIFLWILMDYFLPAITGGAGAILNKIIKWIMEGIISTIIATAFGVIIGIGAGMVINHIIKQISDSTDNTNLAASDVVFASIGIIGGFAVWAFGDKYLDKHYIPRSNNDIKKMKQEAKGFAYSIFGLILATLVLWLSPGPIIGFFFSLIAMLLAIGGILTSGPNNQDLRDEKKTPLCWWEEAVGALAVIISIAEFLRALYYFALEVWGPIKDFFTNLAGMDWNLFDG